MARDATASMSPWRSACCSAFFPVGLMRSPMTCMPSVVTTRVAEQTPLRFTPWRRATSPPSSSTRPNAAMYSGVVPQQPPKIVTPQSSALPHAAANASAVMS